MTLYFQMPVIIDLTMMDIGMILAIVVLPSVRFLMMPDSHSQKKSGWTQDSQANSKGKSSADAKASSDTLTLDDGLSAILQDAQTTGAVKYDEHFIEHFRSLPEDLNGAVAQYLNLADVARASTSCQILHQNLCKTSNVWQVLGMGYGIKINYLGVDESREAVRLAAWRQNLDFIEDIAIEVKKHPPGDPAAPTIDLLSKASRCIRSLRASDGCIARAFCELVSPCLSYHSQEAAMAAKELVESARQSSLPWDVLEALENSYEHGLLQQSLFASCIQEHEDMLEVQLFELEASIAEESKMQNLIDLDLDAMLQAQKDGVLQHHADHAASSA